MSTDIASLALEIDAHEPERAIGTLDRLTAAGRRAEVQADKLSAAHRELEAEARRASSGHNLLAASIGTEDPDWDSG